MFNFQCFLLCSADVPRLTTKKSHVSYVGEFSARLVRCRSSSAADCGFCSPQTIHNLMKCLRMMNDCVLKNNLLIDLRRLRLHYRPMMWDHLELIIDSITENIKFLCWLPKLPLDIRKWLLQLRSTSLNKHKSDEQIDVVHRTTKNHTHVSE